ncbi:MAG: ankyrin repeat domain-containing protein [Chloroflexi bacterium]|nr:ankyrin repeat domain-containing protein [Chloroflexota bacterium]MCY3587139.1 ankyrin repeat domain-containing protein [Chloroflexota bacterium]MCY3686323.1 ankyrin repeat domain-containing protein [Chloroflexota bacterium]MDE2708944.1 ankyrin repeat domain-containing protein [Chloroflexota bacterium]
MTLVGQYRLYGVMALLVMFATMDSLCTKPWPYGGDESVAPPSVTCRIATQPERDDCGRLCDAGFWIRTTEEDVRVELERGADLKARDSLGYSPLHLAVACAKSPTWTSHAEVITVLLDAGADPNRKGPKDFRPLHMAAQHADAEIVELLIQAGAEVDASDDRRMTALHLAAWHNRAESISVLIEAGADAELLDKIGHTPLMLAAWLGGLDALKALLDAGVNPNKRGHDGWTALHHAADSNTSWSEEARRLLLGYGANPQLRNDDGWSERDLRFCEPGRTKRLKVCSQ